ncbi:MAG: hypothetical protein GX163_06775 [Bacteroidetes bacterium]|jgi:ribosome-interacting GTPase 1|nr:hypothetical protein [Bacteroidota bacterium]
MENSKFNELFAKRKKMSITEVIHFVDSKEGKEFHLEVIKRKIAKIQQELSSKGIKSIIEEKENWGKIVVFELKGKKVFCSGYKKNGKMDVWYYSDEYCCNQCRIKF